MDGGSGESSTPSKISAPGKPVRLLFIDPSEEGRSRFRQAIGDFPFIDCHLADRLDTIPSAAGPFDVLVLQAQRHGTARGSLIEGVMRAAAQFPRTAILVLNGDAEPSLREIGLSGVSGFLSRDALPDSLAAAILLASRGMAVLPRAAFQRLRQAARSSSANLRAARRRSVDEPDRLRLTLRQKQVVQLLLEGLPNREIAERLGITESTVKVHVRSILERAGVMSRTQLVLSVLNHAS